MTMLQILDEEIQEQSRQMDRAMEVVKQCKSEGDFDRRSVSEIKWSILEQHPDLSVSDVTIAVDIVTRPAKTY